MFLTGALVRGGLAVHVMEPLAAGELARGSDVAALFCGPGFQG